MLPGPVFQVELTASARRRGHYALRSIYGLLILAVLGQNYLYWNIQVRAGLTREAISTFAYSTFLSFAGAQAVAVVFLTPALISGTIAGETQRRTLHYLMASRLTSAQIVLGKLGARMLLVVVFLLIGLPVMSLLSLLGGVDPRLVALATVATATTAYFLAGLSMLISVHARKVRDAVGTTFALVFAWSIVPAVIESIVPIAWPKVYAQLKPFNDWIGATAPLWPASLMTVLSRSWMTLLDRFRWTITLQLAYGTACLALAVWRLRPAFLAREGGPSRRFDPAKWRWRVFDRPPVGDDPMLWKERFTSRTQGVAKLAGLLMGTALLLLLAYLTYEFGRPAFEELLTGSAGGLGPHRTAFATYLRTVVAALATLLMLGAATTAASGLTAEREEDTWASLLCTDLTGGEIVRAKLFGPAWALRWVVPVVAVLSGIGLLCGVVHPLGVALLFLEMAVFTWFASALGTFLSLRSRSTSRAQTRALAVFLLFNGGYLLLFRPIYFGGWPLLGLGITPMIEWCSFMNPGNLDGASIGLHELWVGMPATDPFLQRMALAVPCCLALYASAAAALTAATVLGFDRAVGRPRRGYEGSQI